MSEWAKFLSRRKSWMMMMASSLKPQAVSVEPRGACSLACQFCYVKKKTGLEVSVERVAEVMDANPSAKTLYVYGGDICDNEAWALALLAAAAARNVQVRASTGAARLTPLLAAAFNSHGVRLQVSLEPQEWGLRVDHLGRPAFSVAAGHGNLQRLNCPVRVNTVIPTSTIVPEVSLGRYLDSVGGLFGHFNWSASYSPEGSENGQLPEWWKRWLSDPLVGDRYDQKRPAQQFNPDMSSGAVMVNCGAASTPVVGPDGGVYSCHTKAVDMELSWRRDGGHAANVERWADMMDNPGCQACPARFACGGVCYLRSVGPHNPQCQFMVSTYEAWASTPAGRDSVAAAAKAREFWPA